MYAILFSGCQRHFLANQTSMGVQANELVHNPMAMFVSQRVALWY